MSAPLDPTAVVGLESRAPGGGGDLLLVLHGFGADEQDLLPVVGAVRGDAAVRSLRGPFRIGPGWSWTPPDPTTTVRGDGLGPTALAVLAWLDGVEAQRGRAARTRLLGFSQGGLLAVQLLREAPERFDRAVLLAGFAPEAPHPGDAVLAERRPPVFLGAGDADPVVERNGPAFERTLTWLTAHTTPTIRRYPGLGHSVSVDEASDVAAFLAAG